MSAYTVSVFATQDYILSMDFMGHGTLCNVAFRGQSALSTMIAAAVCDGGKEDSEQLH